MAGHTPGPWVACEGADGRGCSCGTVWSVSADAPVAHCDTRGEGAPPTVPDLPERQANARLLAAAPDLLAALETIVRKSEGRNRQAIADPDEYDIDMGMRLGLEEAADIARKALSRARGEGES